MANSVTQSILVVGGGMAGMTAALEAAEAGYDVILIEKNPYLGGRVAQLNQYFPKLCPPYCGLEINFKRMRGNRNIRFFTMAEVQQITGQAGDFDVKIKLNPRYVDETNSGDLENSEVCTQEIDNPFNYGMDKVKAIHLPHALAFPQRMVADPSVVKSSQAQQILDANPNSGLDFSMEAKIMDLNVGAIVWAAGWAPYDAKKLDTYGFGEYPNVITNVHDGTPGRRKRSHRRKKSFAPRMVRRRRRWPSSSAPGRGMRITWVSVPVSAVWLRSSRPLTFATRFRKPTSRYFTSTFAPQTVSRISTPRSNRTRKSGSSRVRWPRSRKTRPPRTRF